VEGPPGSTTRDRCVDTQQGGEMCCASADIGSRTGVYLQTIVSSREQSSAKVFVQHLSVIYYNDNAQPPGSPQGHCSTLAMSPTRCVQHNAASIQPCCCGPAGHDGTRNDAGPLPLGGSRRQ